MHLPLFPFCLLSAVDDDEAQFCRAGIEFGFSSTTLDRGVAGFYAKEDKEGKASTIIEARQGMVDRGADISWLSQVD